MARMTFQPDANPETTSVDGHAGRIIVDEAFGTIRAGAGNTSSDSLSTFQCLLLASSTSSQFEQLLRSYMLFDISAIPAGATLKSAVLRLFVIALVTDLTVSGYVVDSGVPASDTGLVNGDYDISNWVDAAHSNVVAPGAITSSVYNIWTLNSTGLAVVQSAVDGDGIARLGLRVNNDLANSAPSWVTGADAHVTLGSADGSNPPELVLTYGPAASAVLY